MSGADDRGVSPVDPAAQKQWVEESLAARLADLKAKFEGPKPNKGDKR